MLSDSERRFYETQPVDQRHITALGKVARAMNDFETRANFPGVGEKTLHELVMLGLAESSSTPSNEVGYRLTDLGWHIKGRGKHPRPFPRE